MSTWKSPRAPQGLRPPGGSPEVAEALLPRRGAGPRGESVLHEPRETAELVHAPGPEPRVVVVEEDHGSLHRIRGPLEILVPRAHLRGPVLLDLVVLLDLPGPDL